MKSLFPVLVFLVACEPLDAPPETLCEEAQQTVQACGVTVPLISDGPCVGLRHSAADCILDYAADCEELVELTREPDICFRELIDPPDPSEPSDPLFPDNPERWVGLEGD